jgi:hypothetical protein
VAQFLKLSEVAINLDAVRYIQTEIGKAQGDGAGCLVCFLGSAEPHAFYGKDAEKVLAAIDENARDLVDA